MEDQTLREILEKAVQKEEESFQFYIDLLERVSDPRAKEELKFVAAEERKHKEFLVQYCNGAYGSDALPLTDVADSKIAEHMSMPEPEGKNIHSRDVYLIAAHREKNSQELYERLAEMQHPGKVKDFLLRMAGEELRHKAKMEYLYVNASFPQTSGG